jgi:uncharacterized phage protein (TIGR01671 family)
MREIKFRGKRADNGEWVYGYYGWSMGKHFITTVHCEYPSFSDPGGAYFESSHDVIEETVGQYTGLKDDYSIKIFEGDLVMMTRGAFYVEWNDDTCQFQFEDGTPINDGDSYGCWKLVAGNIYDINKKP